jgi:epoxyqueuosine reductase
MTPAELSDFIVAECRQLGFHRVGVVPVEAPRRYDAYIDWLERDFHGSMAYLSAAAQRTARADLTRLLAGARTLVVVALAYSADDPPPGHGGAAVRGFVARYARGADYHRVLKQRLYALADRISAALARPVAARPCVDTAPVLERELAERAGVGFIAKNTMVIAPGLGSYILLGELLLDVDAHPTAERAQPPRCGNCRACLDACPTGAIVDAYLLDARRCISYLTIENRGPIPRALRPLVGRMIFGCDICQEVCPFNARAPERTAPDPELVPVSPDAGAPDLIALLDMGANQRRRWIEGTALRRVNREQLMRNACVALGNAGDARAIPALERRLGDRSPLVRAHAAWALGRLGAAESCRNALATETDPTVREELEAAQRAALHPLGASTNGRSNR